MISALRFAGALAAWLLVGIAAALPQTAEEIGKLQQQAQQLFDAGKYAEALVAQRAVATGTEKLETARDGKPGLQTANALNHVSWSALFARTPGEALNASERAHTLAPASLVIETNPCPCAALLGAQPRSREDLPRPQRQVAAARRPGGAMQVYSVRDAKPDEQRELTRLCVRATMQAGYDEAFIDRAMPGLTVTLPLITGGCVQVAQQESGEVVGVVLVTATSLQGIALLYGMFVEPAHWKRGVGRVLFGAAATRAKALKAGVLMIYAEPSAEGFYKRMGATRVGEGTFYYSPEIVLPQLLYILPRDVAPNAKR